MRTRLAESALVVVAFQLLGCVNSGPAPADPAGRDATADVETADKETADVDTADKETADVETPDAETADVETADIETPDAETADVDNTDTDASTCEGLRDCSLCACQTSFCPAGSPQVASSCSPPSGQPSAPPDECACEGGVCQAGMTCVRVFHPAPFGAGGPGSDGNICEELCAVDADCGSGRVCRRDVFGLTVCAAPSCVSDSDCTADPCGHCLPGLAYFHAGRVVLDFSRSECVYEGRCGSDSCAGCLLNARVATKANHYCGVVLPPRPEQ